MSHRAELISTGAELLSGRTVNCHGQTLGRALASLGIDLVRDTTVPDDLDQISESFRGALDRVELVFVSGGLGPTSDDKTRDALAQVLDRAIVMDPGALDLLTERYQRAGREVTEMAQRQVLVLEGADVLLNPAGLAPGQRLPGPGGQTVFVLPGPPHEFDAILETHILPWLRKQWAPESPLLERLFMVGAVPEADVARRFEEAGLPPAGVHIGYCAAPGRVEVRLYGHRPELLEACAEKARSLLAEDVFAEMRMSMEEAVIHGLANSHATLSSIEGASDGLLARNLMAIRHSRDVYRGGIVAGCNQPMIDLCGVSSALIREQGSVSEAVACRLAAGIRDQFGTDIGLAVTAASKGHPHKPDGQFVVGIDQATGTQAFVHRSVGRGTWRAEWIAGIALNRLRRSLGLPVQHAAPGYAYCPPAGTDPRLP